MTDTGIFVLPEKYSGSEGDCNGFLLKVRIAIASNASHFPTDCSKIMFLVTLLEGRALTWAEAVWSRATGSSTTFEDFARHFKEIFGQPSGGTTASDQLLQLRQGSDTVLDYIIRFRTLAASSGWNDQALISAYRHGLGSVLQLQLAVAEDSLRLEGLMNFALRVAARRRAHDLSTQSTARPRRVPLQGFTEEPQASTEEMQVDYTRLSQEERRRRIARGLCLYCGQSGHHIDRCPTRPQRTLVSVITSPVAKCKPLTILVYLLIDDNWVPVHALIDSGSAGYFVARLLTPPSISSSPSQGDLLGGVKSDIKWGLSVSKWAVSIRRRLLS